MKAINYSKASNLKQGLSGEKQRRFSFYADSLFALRRRIYPYIDRDGYLFEKIMSTKGRRRAHYLKKSQALVVDVAEACCEVFFLAKKIHSDIKKSIMSDFFIGKECVKLALRGCVANLEANERLFGIKEEKLKVFKNTEKRWL